MPHIAFRPIGKDDLKLIADWLARPHVSRWWGDPRRGLEKIREHISSRGVTGFVVSFGSRPFAYLQCYDPSLDPENVWGGQPEGTRGLDLFIGEEEFLGRGHGSALLRIFSDGLLSQPPVSRVIGDPEPENRASVGAFENAGFRPAGEKDMPWGRVLVLVKEPGSGSGK